MGDEGIPGIGVDTVEEVRLFVIVRRENDVVDNSLEDLGKNVLAGYLKDDGQCMDVRRVVALGCSRQTPCLALGGNACKLPDTCRHASLM